MRLGRKLSRWRARNTSENFLSFVSDSHTRTETPFITVDVFVVVIVVIVVDVAVVVDSTAAASYDDNNKVFFKSENSDDLSYFCAKTFFVVVVVVAPADVEKGLADWQMKRISSRK